MLYLIFVFDVSSSNNFWRLLDEVDLSEFTVLLWLFIVIILLGIMYMPFTSSDYVLIKYVHIH